MSRPDYFDYIHADEPYEPFRTDMGEDEYRLFLLSQDENSWLVLCQDLAQNKMRNFSL
jgi:hypothetical protein